MGSLGTLVKRNCKLFFKDKVMFFTSLITPIVLLVLFGTFLANVYRDSIVSAIPEGFSVSEAIINGAVGGQLVSSILAVCCVTVAFCSNFLIVQDKIEGSRRDLDMCPVSSSTLALGYFLASAICTLLICYIGFAACLGYLYAVGWYLSISDVLFLCLDIFISVLFGTALSSIINCNLTSNGQVTAVGTIISAGYGFICGAYMPIHSFAQGLQDFLSYIPCTYATGLFRNHALGGVLDEMLTTGLPSECVDGFRDSLDCNLSFLGNNVSIESMYGVVIATLVVLIVLYILISKIKKNK